MALQPRPPVGGSKTVVDLRDERLSELVEALTGCATTAGRHALRERTVPLHPTEPPVDALELVARAMVHVTGPAPDGFRVAGYLRDDLALRTRKLTGRRLPRRVSGGLPHRQPLPHLA